MNLAEEEVFRARVRGCLLAEAIGDALGAPIEFDSVAAIRAAHGSAGVTDFVPVGGEYGKVTDDTQMTLFTVDGLIRAGIRRDRGIGFNPVGPVHVAYLAWLTTQQRAEPEDGAGGFLLRERWLYARRAGRDVPVGFDRAAGCASVRGPCRQRLQGLQGGDARRAVRPARSDLP